MDVIMKVRSHQPGVDILVVDDISFAHAKAVELENWSKNKVYDEIPNKGQKYITTRWVCTAKETKEGIISKARLVARGFEDLEGNNVPKDSPTCSTESL